MPLNSALELDRVSFGYEGAARQAISDFSLRIAARTTVGIVGGTGAGKTTLVRGILRGLGWRGNVKSPTYTLVEPYEIGGRAVYHLDLYRLSDPAELEYLGLREMLDEDLDASVFPDLHGIFLLEQLFQLLEFFLKQSFLAV